MGRGARATALCAALAGAAAAEVRGAGRAIDGDTLAIGRTTVRLHGVDSPEAAQTCMTAAGAEWDCGAAARERLAALLDAGEAVCVAVESDRYGRVVARCAAGGVDIGARLVAEGLAWAYLRYSRAYASLEAEARAAGRGVWQGEATLPSDWRAAAGRRDGR